MDIKTKYSPDKLRECTCCPRHCGVDRLSTRSGYCKSGAGISIGSICAHRGEEPVISGTHGICNIFFTRCNMQCIYCQNYDISRTTAPVRETEMSLTELVDHIETHLDSGCKSVGFVSPSHYLPQVFQIIKAVHDRGRKPVFIYNSNGYDTVEAIKALNRVIDVYLPDFKYSDEQLAREFSHAPHYPEIAADAIGEMYRQRGAEIELDKDGLIRRGLIIRHLVLPGHVENSKGALRYIAEHFSPDCYISLMSQYYPTPAVADHPALGRCLRSEEYDDVLEEFDRLGFHRGWVQQLSSADNYRPRFEREHPFE